ncbi:MAG: hypothetical protein Q9174_004459, partial [Haloplaca sp. 1 TL-2023]
MKYTDFQVLLACCALGSITGVSSLAHPRGFSSFPLGKRQDDLTPEGELDPAGTGNLRDCKPPKDVYIDQDTVEWNEVNKDKTKLEVTTTTEKGVKEIPAPKTAWQGNRFVVDHVLELAVVVAAFEDDQRDNDEAAKKIPQEAWDKAKEAVDGEKDNCKTVADEITVLDNLLGVAESVNLGKEQVYKKVLDGTTDTDLDKKWNNYTRAIEAYLEDYKSKVEGVIDNAAAALGELTNEDKVKDYAARYWNDKYVAGQDYVHKQVEKLPDDGDDDEESQDGAGGDCIASG